MLCISTYTLDSLTLRIPCDMSSWNSFQTLMPSFRFSSWDIFTFDARTWRSVWISCSTYEHYSYSLMNSGNSLTSIKCCLVTIFSQCLYQMLDSYMIIYRLLRWWDTMCSAYILFSVFDLNNTELPELINLRPLTVAFTLRMSWIYYYMNTLEHNYTVKHCQYVLKGPFWFQGNETDTLNNISCTVHW
jgi:hypothetical protein